MAQFLATFRIYAQQSGYDEEALITRFKFSVKPDIARRILERVPRPHTLNEWYDLAVEYDRNIMEAQAFARGYQRPYDTGSDLTRFYRDRQPNRQTNVRAFGDNQPKANVTKVDKDKALKERLCFECGKPGHQAKNCRLRDKRFKHNTQARVGDTMGTIEEVDEEDNEDDQKESENADSKDSKDF